MSYCKFENTENDLSDCLQTLMAMKQGDGWKLSQSELDHFKTLSGLCLSFIEELTDCGLDCGRGNIVTPEMLEDSIQLIHDDQGNIKYCENCGEKFILEYEGQTICGMNDLEGCIDPAAPEWYPNN